MPNIKDPLLIERHAQQMYGCSHAEAIKANDGLALRDRQSKAYAYAIQRHAANRRNVEWRISFPEWVQVWSDSNRWEQRGCRKGQFVMSRFKDVGPYAASNVEIKTSSENCAEGVRKGNAQRKRAA
jgi:hypothetical protein